MSDMMFNNLVGYLGNNGIDLSADVIKCMLITGDPVSTWDEITDVPNEHAQTGNYTTGGVVVAGTWSAVDGIGKFDVDDPSWANLTIAGVTHAIFYSSTTNKLICARMFATTKSGTYLTFGVGVNANGLFRVGVGLGV